MKISKFLGGFGALMQPRKRTKPSPMKTVGGMGTAILGGYVQSVETSSELAGRAKYKVYSEMLANTSIVAAGVRFYLNLLARAEWVMQPPKGMEEDEQAIELADTCLEILHDMETPWRRVVKRGGMYRLHGYAIQEITAKVRPDGVIGLKDIAPRPQITIERWDVDREGRVIGVIQRLPQTQEEVYLPRGKILYVVDDTLNDSPEGLGLYRSIVEASRRLTRYEQLEGYGFEGDLRGIPIGRAPYGILAEMVKNGDISQEQMDTILAPMEEFIESHVKNPQLGMILDSQPYASEDETGRPSNVPQWNLDLLKAGNTSLEPINTAISRLNREIARVLGVESLLLGEGSAGSFALSEDKTTNFGLIVEDSLQEIAWNVRSDVLRPLFELNGWPIEKLPRPQAGGIQQRDIAKVTGALKDLAAAGVKMSGEDPAVNQIRDRLGLDHATVVEEVDPLELIAAEAEARAPKPGEPPTEDGGEDKGDDDR